MSKELTCKKISKGKVEGEVILSNDTVYFHMVGPETGRVIKSSRYLKDKSTAGKILVMPSERGSSVAQIDGLYRLQLHGKAPKAIIVQHAGTVLTSSAIIMKIPTMHEAEEGFYQEIKSGTKICMDTDNRKITIF